jgi:ABC-type sulfate/molybdate transport systems ATPase subunit
MLSVTVFKQFNGFTLDAAWSSTHPIVALVGPSGSGKTLTLQCIAGLITPDMGRVVAAERVLFDGAGRINLKPQERRIGYVFQGYALFPHMTVAQNIANGQRARGRARIDLSGRSSSAGPRRARTRYPPSFPVVAVARALRARWQPIQSRCRRAAWRTRR